MTGKTEALRSFEAVDSALDDSRETTLARALDDALAARDATFRYRNEVMEELERFRLAVREDLKGLQAAKRRFDARDLLAGSGLLMLAVGIAVAFHWAYALMAVGLSLATLGIVTSAQAPVPPKTK